MICNECAYAAPHFNCRGWCKKVKPKHRSLPLDLQTTKVHRNLSEFTKQSRRAQRVRPVTRPALNRLIKGMYIRLKVEVKE